MRDGGVLALRGTAPRQPLLSGRLAERARNAIVGIARALEQASDGLGPDSSTTLAAGSAGWGIFLAYAKSAGYGDGLQFAAERCLQHAIERMAASPMTPGLFVGFTGTAWVATHLAGRLGGPFPVDAFAEVDGALDGYVQESPWRNGFDLIHGLVGLGVYALERLPQPGARSTVEKVIDRLQETAERLPGGIAWPTLPESMPWVPSTQWELHRHDLGMAHGTPGVIAFLSMTYAAGVAQDRVRALATQSIGWLLQHKNGDGSQSHFSTFVLTPRSRRTAWCYGDPGVAAALCLAGRSMGQREWEREGRALAHAVASRPPEHSGVRDAGLCHGASGIAHVLHRLSLDSDDEGLGQAAREWFERALDMRRPGEGCAGFATYMPDEKRTSRTEFDPGFLMGCAGIGLALLAAVSEVPPEWDRALLLSLPATPAP